MAPKMNRASYRLNVALREIHPPIWRRIQEAPLSITAVIITIVAWIVFVIMMRHRWR